MSLVILLFLLISIQGLRISQRFQQEAAESNSEEGEGIISEILDNSEDTSSESTQQSNSEATTLNADEIVDMVNSQTEGNEDVSLMTTTDILVIERTDESTEDSEVDTISLNHRDMESLARNEYKKIRNKFTYSEVTLEINDNNKGFHLEITSEDGKATSTDVIDFLNLNGKFNDLHDHFQIRILNVPRLICYYVTDEEVTKIDQSY